MLHYIKCGIIIFAFTLLGCSKEPAIDENTMLDGNKVVDSALLAPEKYLTSVRNAEPSASLKSKPVVLAVHGYCATTFEWMEFFNLHDSSHFQVSLITLGGHGDSYEALKAATWEDWQSSIKTEYEALVSKGYTNISLLGSSTACPLIIQLLEDNYFEHLQQPKNIIFIDPIVVASNKLLALVKAVGPIIGYSPMELEDGEVGYWYNYRPQESLQELQELLVKTRKDLQKGIALPLETTMHVYKAKKDEIADPIAAPLLFSGIEVQDPEKFKFTLVNSDLHVFTRLNGRAEYSPLDLDNQLSMFSRINGILIH